MCGCTSIVASCTGEAAENYSFSWLILVVIRNTDWPKQAFSFGAFYFAYYSFVGVFPAYVSLYLAFREISPFEIGMLMAVMQGTRIIGPILWGGLADLTGRRDRMLQLTAAAALVTFIGFFFPGTFWYFIVFMFGVNIFTSAQGPLSDTLILGEMRNNMSRYGQLRLWGSIGYIVMTAAAGYVFEKASIACMPWLGATVLGITLIISLRIYQTSHVEPVQRKTSIWQVLFRKEVMAFMVSSFFMQAAHASLYSFYSLYLADFGYSSFTIGVMWASGAVAEILFFIFHDSIIKYIGVKWLLLGSLLIAIVRFLMIGFGAIAFLILVVAQILHAATFGAHHVSSIFMVRKWFPEALQARGQAIYISASWGIGGTLGAFILSFVWAKMSHETIYWCAAFMALVGLIVAWLACHWDKQIA